MAERKKLAVIDGKSVFYRGYYALPNLSTGDGIPTGGVYGFAAMSLELIKKLQPDYVAVAWDKPKTNIRRRKELYPEYKAGRKPPPPDFYAQIPLLHELLEAFSWPLYEFDDYEADDIMGTLAVQAEKKGLETLLITSDLDMLQLVNHRVKVYALKKGFSNIEEFHPESFEQKYGIKATQFLDLKSLKGDSSDNIPGVPGIGEKTALDLLKQYKTLDGVYDNLHAIKDSTRKKLEAGRELAALSKKLSAIWCDAPLKLNLSEMDGSKIDTDHLLKLLQRLEFRSLIKNLPDNMQANHQDTEYRAQSTKSTIKLPSNTLIDSDKDLPKFDELAPGKIFIHSRAAGRHGADPQVLILGDNKQIYTLDLTKLSPAAVRKTINHKPSTTNSLIGYDVKSDMKLLKGLGLEFRTVGHDALIAAFLLNPLLRAQSLTDLAVASLGYEGVAFEDLPTEDFIARAPELMAIIRDLYEYQKEELKKYTSLQKLAAEIEWPLTAVLADMEYTGIEVEPKYLKKVAAELGEQISDITQTIYGLVDEEFNLNSPQQVSRIFFEKLGLPTEGIKKLPSGYLSTDVNTLNKLAGKNRVVDEFIRHREYSKLKNTYADVLPQLADDNNRIHTTFNLTIAPTGRLSSADPNLQQIPTKTELGKQIERGFVAGKGNLLVSADYSQFELRLAAALSGDEGMIDAFNNDVDIHVQTASLVYGIKPEDVTKQQRYEAKAVNFGIMYGQGPHGLSVGTGMDYGAARKFIARYFEIRPKLKDYIESIRAQADKQGYVEDLLGRRRPTPDVKSSNFAVREAAYRAAVNMPLQGSAADIMKIAMIKVQEHFDRFTDDSKQVTEKPRMLLQIHDSILVECFKHQAEQVGKILKDTMENAYKLPVKLKVDVSTGQNWGELQKMMDDEK